MHLEITECSKKKLAKPTCFYTRLDKNHGQATENRTGRSRKSIETWTQSF